MPSPNNYVACQFSEWIGTSFIVLNKIRLKISDRAMLDTGATMSLTSADFLTSLKQSILPTNLTAKWADQQSAEVLGVVNNLFLVRRNRWIPVPCGVIFGHILFDYVKPRYCQWIRAYNSLRQCYSQSPWIKQKLCIGVSHNSCRRRNSDGIFVPGNGNVDIFLSLRISPPQP